MRCNAHHHLRWTGRNTISMGSGEVVIETLLAIAVFASAFLIDFAHAKYARDRDLGLRVRASLWSVAQWCAASIGFAVAVKVSLWYLPFEGAGLFMGTFIAMGKKP
jgi:hypothetical protein